MNIKYIPYEAQFFPTIINAISCLKKKKKITAHRPKINKNAMWSEMQFHFPININNLSSISKCPSQTSPSYTPSYWPAISSSDAVFHSQSCSGP